MQIERPTELEFRRPLELIRCLASAFLAVALASERGFDPLFLARLQIERMLLDFLDDVLLLDLPFEAAKGVFKRLPFLDPHFRHTIHPLTVWSFIQPEAIIGSPSGKVKRFLRPETVRGNRWSSDGPGFSSEL